jgi:hypothetical protein
MFNVLGSGQLETSHGEGREKGKGVGAHLGSVLCDKKDSSGRASGCRRVQNESKIVLVCQPFKQK